MLSSNHILAQMGKLATNLFKNLHRGCWLHSHVIHGVGNNRLSPGLFWYRSHWLKRNTVVWLTHTQKATQSMTHWEHWAVRHKQSGPLFRKGRMQRSSPWNRSGCYSTMFTSCHIHTPTHRVTGSLAKFTMLCLTWAYYLCQELRGAQAIAYFQPSMTPTAKKKDVQFPVVWTWANGATCCKFADSFDTEIITVLCKWERQWVKVMLRPVLPWNIHVITTIGRAICI